MQATLILEDINMVKLQSQKAFWVALEHIHLQCHISKICLEICMFWNFISKATPTMWPMTWMVLQRQTALNMTLQSTNNHLNLFLQHAPAISSLVGMWPGPTPTMLTARQAQLQQAWQFQTTSWFWLQTLMAISLWRQDGQKTPIQSHLKMFTNHLKWSLQTQTAWFMRQLMTNKVKFSLKGVTQSQPKTTQSAELSSPTWLSQAQTAFRQPLAEQISLQFPLRQTQLAQATLGELILEMIIHVFTMLKILKVIDILFKTLHGDLHLLTKLTCGQQLMHSLNSRRLQAEARHLQFCGRQTHTQFRLTQTNLQMQPQKLKAQCKIRHSLMMSLKRFQQTLTRWLDMSSKAGQLKLTAKWFMTTKNKFQTWQTFKTEMSLSMQFGHLQIRRDTP